MQWSIVDETDGDFVRVTIHGVFDHDDHQRLVADLVSRPFWRPGRKTLFDDRDLDLASANFDTMARAAGTHIDRKAKIGASRTAVLMGSPAAFGLGRQFQSLVGDSMDTVIQVFLDEAQAISWLTNPAGGVD